MFFASGQSSIGLIDDKTNIALAICYELSVPEHAENAYKNGPAIYLANVVESVGDIEKAAGRSSESAEKYSMTVLMANCVGQTGVYGCGGNTSVWNDAGSLVGQLNDTNEGILIFDADTEKTIEKTI